MGRKIAVCLGNRSSARDERLGKRRRSTDTALAAVDADPPLIALDLFEIASHARSIASSHVSLKARLIMLEFSLIERFRDFIPRGQNRLCAGGRNQERRARRRHQDDYELIVHGIFFRVSGSQ
jgi:hypothetical protein